MILLRKRQFRAQLAQRPTPDEIKNAAALNTPIQRARALLLTHLTREQQRTFKSGGYIRLIGNRGSRFCLHSEPTVRVYELNRKNEHVRDFCSHADRWQYRSVCVPVADQVLAHLLFLQAAETDFRHLAPSTRLGLDNRRYLAHH